MDFLYYPVGAQLGEKAVKYAQAIVGAELVSVRKL